MAFPIPFSSLETDSQAATSTDWNFPFYIFSHEKNFKVYNSDEQLEELKAEYQDILARSDQLEQEGELSIDKIAKYSRLAVAEVEQLAGLQTV